MGPEELAGAADPAVLGGYLAEVAPADDGHAHGPVTTVREDTFEGHRIVLRTTYEITVDDEPLPVHLMVADDGTVHCHALPNFQFHSALASIRALIRSYPDDFAPGDGEPHREHRLGGGGR
ncbi:hypothetical protein [Streptomyces alkaliterrae]|uniref:Uncharacterized protein n=1 Tax=Streptomyces alkaliterrae TaxID=2213162 RepID=A0A5P0YNU3_9ACTN|nr:hypothetical protein [Streptomyces alkaliterrae]MBB1253741.1 hypothetical protein [Streptomyces alkaliterrae]MBB1260250.1 hypothetical protein [Streptomyces alkaliterrae]MQS01908.1 hypothetical protein [Streptomyces alkaliterrae]